MQTIILNYYNWKIYIFSHNKNYDNEKIEKILTIKHDFSLNDIERMTVDKLEFENL